MVTWKYVMLGHMTVHKCPLYYCKRESSQDAQPLCSILEKKRVYLEHEKLPRVIIFLRFLPSLAGFYACTL